MAMDKTLQEFIRAVGSREAARLFDEEPRTVESWRYGKRFPRYWKAAKIVQACREHQHGPVTLEGIYGSKIDAV